MRLLGLFGHRVVFNRWFLFSPKDSEISNIEPYYRYRSFGVCVGALCGWGSLQDDLRYQTGMKRSRLENATGKKIRMTLSYFLFISLKKTPRLSSYDIFGTYVVVATYQYVFMLWFYSGNIIKISCNVRWIFLYSVNVIKKKILSAY